jgi:hypothetical protein
MDSADIERHVRTFMYYTFAFSWTNIDKNFDLVMGLSFGSWTERRNLLDVSEPDGYHDIILQGRYFLQKDERTSYIPHLGISFGSHGASYRGILSRSISSSIFQVNAGCGANLKPNEKALIAGDFGFLVSSKKREQSDQFKTSELKESDFKLYLQLGAEGNLNKWMKIRMGAADVLNLKTNEVKPYTTSESYNSKIIRFGFPSATYLGLGFQFGKLDVDTYINPKIFLEGFNVFSGRTNSMNFQISALYNFL